MDIDTIIKLISRTNPCPLEYASDEEDDELLHNEERLLNGKDVYKICECNDCRCGIPRPNYECWELIVAEILEGDEDNVD